MKRTLLIVSLLVLALGSMAEMRTSEQAAQIAASTLSKSADGIRRLVPAQMQLRRTVMQTKVVDQPAYYIFAPQSNNGFVVVSADDRAVDVLCYSDEGRLDEATMNPQMRWWLSRFQDQLSNIPDDAPVYAPEAVQYTAVSPMLVTEWDQGTPYNNYCPVSYYYPTERCLTGCVATATAQIMKFWEWPVQGTGSHSYTYPEYRDLDDQRGHQMSDGLSFDTITFDWANMRRSYSGSYTAAQARAVAQLMHACGVACDMSYAAETAGGSGAWTDAMGYGLETYFSYKSSTFITMYSSADYGEASMDNVRWSQTASQIQQAVLAEVAAGRPVLMGGEAGEDGGHEFVCDGCDANGRLHIDWGWSGDCNCYTAITAMQPSSTSYRFKDNLDALIGLEPNRQSSDTTGGTTLTLIDGVVKSEAVKVVRDGHILILRDGVSYDLMGRVVR